MDLSEVIDQYSLSEYGHTDWGWISYVDREELKNRDHILQFGHIVFFIEPDEEHS